MATAPGTDYYIRKLVLGSKGIRAVRGAVFAAGVQPSSRWCRCL